MCVALASEARRRELRATVESEFAEIETARQNHSHSEYLASLLAERLAASLCASR